MRIMHIAGIAFLVFLVYANSLSGNFVYDDSLIIVNNNFVKSPDNLRLLFNRRYLTHPLEASFDQGTYNIGSGESSYRPVATLSYFLNYALFKMKPFGYRMTNLVLHIFCAALVYVLVYMLFGKVRLALFSAILFGVHPVNVEVVNCTAFRPNTLAFLFCLLSLIFYFKSKAADSRSRLCLAVSVSCALLAVFSKEIAVILPLAIILCDYYQSNYDTAELFRNRRKYLLYLLADAFYILIYFLMMFPAQRIFGSKNIFANAVRMFDITGIYIKDMFVPNDLLLIDSAEIYLSYLRLALGIIAFMIALFLLLKKRRFNPALSFGVIWFFLWLTPMNNFLNTFRILAAYRYLYIPLLGFAVFLGFMLNRIWEGNSRVPVLQRLVPAAYITYFSIFTVSANATWKNDMVLHMSKVEKNPESVYAHIMFGTTLLKYGDYAGAKEEFERVLSSPDLARYNAFEIALTYSNLGFVYMLEGQYKQAEDMYRQALKRIPNVAYIYSKIGYCLARQGSYDKALDYLNQAKKMNPLYSTAYLYAGITYMSMQKYPEAKSELLKALQITPDYQDAKNKLQELEAIQKGKKA